MRVALRTQVVTGFPLLAVVGPHSLIGFASPKRNGKGRRGKVPLPQVIKFLEYSWSLWVKKGFHGGWGLKYLH